MKSRPRKLHADDHLARGISRSDMNNAALGRKFRIRFVGGLGRRYPNVQSASQFDGILGGKGSASAAKIYAQGLLLEQFTATVGTTNDHGKVHRDPSFPAALEGWVRSAGRCQSVPHETITNLRHEQKRHPLDPEFPPTRVRYVHFFAAQPRSELHA